MFGNHTEKQRIRDLKVKSDVERQLLASNVSSLVPYTRKASTLIVYGMAAKNLAPLARPVFFGLVQRGLANRGKSKLYRLKGLASTAIGIARAIRAKDSKVERAVAK